jgi:hypothetical protein
MRKLPDKICTAGTETGTLLVVGLTVELGVGAFVVVVVVVSGCVRASVVVGCVGGSVVIVVLVDSVVVLSMVD